MNDTLAPEFWLVIGGLLVVFVLPAVAILLVRDFLRKHLREREERPRQVQGFEVRPPSTHHNGT